MKKVLIVTSRFPWPLTNGFANKNYWLIRGLSDKYEITLCVIQSKPVLPSGIDKISEFCKDINIYRPTLFDMICRAFRSFILDQPFQLALFYSSQCDKFIQSNLREFDHVICSVIRSVQYFRRNYDSVVCDFADSLGQVYRRDAPKFVGLKKFVYLEEGRRMLNYERSLVRKVGKALFFNRDEASYFNQPSVIVVPHGTDPRLFDLESTHDSYADGVVIFGRMAFEPNIDAVEWFASNVLCHLPRSIRLYAVGADPSPRLLKLSQSDPRVIVTGFIEDPYPALRGAIACICPVQIGGGIQNKVIEALAVGSLCLISPLAAKPMPELCDSGLIVCDTPSDWVSTILDVANNKHKYLPLRDTGRVYAKRHFSWGSYTDSVKSALSEVSQNKISIPSSL